MPARLKTMNKRLHITNGDSAGDMLTEIFSGEDEILCWRDVLHDGPLTLAPLAVHRRRRSRFLADTLEALGDKSLGDRPYDRIYADFLARDHLMAELEKYAAVTLWFEHDLYDQLQIAEILHRLSVLKQPVQELSLICIDAYPEVPYFHGLGNLNPSQLADLYPSRQPLGERQLAAGRRIWQTLCAPDPRGLPVLAATVYDGLPYMPAALRRYCQEFPNHHDGLTRTQSLLLKSVGAPLSDLPELRHHLQLQAETGRLPAGASAESRYREVMSGPLRFGRIFMSLQSLEPAPFMGDLWVRKELIALCEGPTPYLDANAGQDGPLHSQETTYTLTGAGRQALSGQIHWTDENGYDLWRGGVHLCGDRIWYWDEAGQTFTDHV
jgi:hypothetical protein